MTTGVNVTAPGVGHDPLDSGSKVARSSPPFLPKTHLRPIPTINIGGTQALNDKLKTISATMRAAFDPQLVEHLAAISTELHAFAERLAFTPQAER